MAAARCSVCGQNFYWYGGRGRSKADAISPCHHAVAAPGRMVVAYTNNLRDEYAASRIKVYVIGGKLITASYPGELQFVRADDTDLIFTPTHVPSFRPAHVPADWISYFRFDKIQLKQIGFSV